MTDSNNSNYNINNSNNNINNNNNNSNINNSNINNIVKHLRKCLLFKEAILNNERRVQTFTSKDVQSVLTDDSNNSKINKILSVLLKQEIIVKVTVLKSNTKNVTINLSKTPSVNDTYIFVNDDTTYLHTLIAVVIIILVLGLICFQVWPSNIRKRVSLFIYPVLAFFIFIGVLAVIRIIVFIFTYFLLADAVWIFPNLFADVGFIDSFIPVWAYHGEDVRPEKKED